MRLCEIDLKRGISSRDIYVDIEIDLLYTIDEMYSNDICYDYSRSLPCGNMMYLIDVDDEGILYGQSRFIYFYHDGADVSGGFFGNQQLYSLIWEYIWGKLNL